MVTRGASDLLGRRGRTSPRTLTPDPARLIIPLNRFTGPPRRVAGGRTTEDVVMRRVLMAAAVLGLSVGVSFGDEIKSGPTSKIGGPFNVKAFTGEKKGQTLCYVCKYGAEARPAVVLIFTRKADENLAKLVKSVDEVQKSNSKLGTVVVGVGGVE